MWCHRPCKPWRLQSLWRVDFRRHWKTDWQTRFETQVQHLAGDNPAEGNKWCLCVCVGCLCCPPYHTFGELAITFRLDSLVSDKTWAGQPCVWSNLGWTALCIAIPCWAYGAGQPCAWWICDSLGGCMHNAQGKCSQKVPPYAWIWAGIAKEREKLVLAWMKWMAGNQNTPLCGCFSCRSSAWGSCQLQMSKLWPMQHACLAAMPLICWGWQPWGLMEIACRIATGT